MDGALGYGLLKLAQALDPCAGPSRVKFHIDEPCDERLDLMEPRAGGKYCARCETVVIDLSGVTRAQAEAKMRQVRGDTVCVQLRVDRFGDAVFVPPPKRAAHWSRGLVLVAALTGGGCNLDEPGEPAQVVAIEEPELAPFSDLGPPMTPSAAVIHPAQEVAPTQAVPASELNPSPIGSARPTAQQRALTAAKHRPPIHHMRAGGMRMPSNYGNPF